MDLEREHEILLTRRGFFGRTAAGIGAAAPASVLDPELLAAPEGSEARPSRALVRCRNSFLNRSMSLNNLQE